MCPIFCLEQDFFLFDICTYFTYTHQNSNETGFRKDLIQAVMKVFQICFSCCFYQLVTIIMICDLECDLVTLYLQEFR